VSLEIALGPRRHHRGGIIETTRTRSPFPRALSPYFCLSLCRRLPIGPLDRALLHREIEPRLFPLLLEAGGVEKIAKRLERARDIPYELICSMRSSGNINIAADAAIGNRPIGDWNIRRLRADSANRNTDTTAIDRFADDRGWSRDRRRGHERTRAGLTKALTMRKRARDAGAKGKTRSSDSAAGETGGNECLEGRRHFELSLHHRQNQIAAAAAAAAIVVVAVVVVVVVVVVETLEKITTRTDLAATFVRSPLSASCPAYLYPSAPRIPSIPRPGFRAISQAETGAEAAEKGRLCRSRYRDFPKGISETLRFPPSFDYSNRRYPDISTLSFQFIRMSYRLSDTEHGTRNAA